MRIFAGVAGAHGKHLKIKNCGKILKFTSRTTSVAPLGIGRGKSCEATRGWGFPTTGKVERSEEEERAKRTGDIMCIPEFEAGPKCYLKINSVGEISYLKINSVAFRTHTKLPPVWCVST
jgi:hypothetical protein